MEHPFLVMFKRPLGKKIEASKWKPLRDVIGDVSRSDAGNLVVRAGTEIEPGGSWERTLHIVLTADEAQALVESIEMLIPEVRPVAKKT